MNNKPNHMNPGYKDKTLVALIPARMGSTRLPMKNLVLLKGKPLIYYAIHAAKKAGVFKHIVIDSEDVIFSKIAKRYTVEFYQRPARWATSTAKSDYVVHDFIKNHPCDIVVWVNPISPLQTGKEIRQVVDYFFKEKLDSLITVKDENVHAVYKNKPINFKMDAVFARTQDLKPVQPFVYSIMMWRTDVFMRAFKKKKHALFCGKVGFYPVNKFSAVIIKRKEDLMMAQSLLGAVNKGKSFKIKYDRIINTIKGEK